MAFVSFRRASAIRSRIPTSWTTYAVIGVSSVFRPTWTTMPCPIQALLAALEHNLYLFMHASIYRLPRWTTILTAGKYSASFFGGETGGKSATVVSETPPLRLDFTKQPSSLQQTHIRISVSHHHHVNACTCSCRSAVKCCV